VLPQFCDLTVPFGQAQWMWCCCLPVQITEIWQVKIWHGEARRYERVLLWSDCLSICVLIYSAFSNTKWAWTWSYHVILDHFDQRHIGFSELCHYFFLIFSVLCLPSTTLESRMTPRSGGRYKPLGIPAKRSFRLSRWHTVLDTGNLSMVETTLVGTNVNTPQNSSFVR
jgi:hypothetical protein